MRKIAAAAVAIPFVIYYLFSGLFRRVMHGRSIPTLPVRVARPRLPSGPAMSAGLFQGVAVVGAVALLVTGLLIGLPAKQVAGNAPASFSPLAPQGAGLDAQTNLPLDVPFKVQFTKPMNANSVENAFTISPNINVKFLWDATDQVLSIKPDPHWEPFAHYELDISAAATDQEGLGIAAPITTYFDAGSPTSGTITATQMSDGLASPGTAFQVTFSRPVKLATVVTRVGISPHVDFYVAGDDPTDAASQTFTLTPKTSLEATKLYLVSMNMGTGNEAAVDSAGSPITDVPSLSVTTMTTPTVVRFRPQDGVSNDTNQPVSVRFTMPMDTKSTAAAFSVTVNGKAVSGSLSWSENNTVLVLVPRYSFKVQSTIVAKVGSGARSAGGLHLAGSPSSTFKISTPKSTGIAYGPPQSTGVAYGPTGGTGAAAAKWYSSEVYYLNLMNCTRSGRWVTGSGACSTETHHTLPAPGNLLRLNADISNRVSRPYAKYMADNVLMDHFLRGTSPHSRLCAAGYCRLSWAENIGNGGPGMVALEIFYQNESWCRCEHYANIMAPFVSEVGIGVYVSNSNRVSIDFYG
ncbi:MAG TPA: Ig-like domain-containing protein [Candidatus Limnocylindrales bacterium]